MPSEDWTPERVKEALYKERWTPTALALAHGISESACRCALIRHIPCGEMAIANALGLKPHEIWPSRYPNAGAQMRPSVPRDASAKRATTHRQKVAGA